MPVRPDLQQLEKCIDDALRKNDFKPLRTLLQIDICEDTKIKCSKQFFYKLDDLICRELRKRDIQAVSIILVSVGRCGKNISILGQAGLPTMLKQGLIQKIKIVLDQENSKDEAVINMVEDFFDVLMVIHDVNDEGKRQIVKSFAPRICALVIDSRVNIYIQQETLKRMNAMLDKIPEDARKILSNQEMLTLMSGMGERILDAGDYDLQVGIVEALCRMTTETQRQELACHWFTMDFIANAFKEIKDSEFETDCRRFLNLVNGMLGDKRRVFTFPCLSAFLDNYELQIPSDEKLEEFWIDFNLGSQTLSFYIAGDHDEHQWEAVTVPEEMVHLYSIEVRESKKLLTIILKNRIRISKREGKELHLYFDVSLEITNVTQKIFGADKYRDFTKKQSISIAKTSVHILFDASGSQILVPESQVSPAEELSSLKQKADSPKELPKPPQYVQNSNQEDERSSQLQMFTPSKRKMSEASMIVPGTDIYTERSPVLLINTLTPRRERVKPPLQLMTSAKQAGVSKSSADGAHDAESLKPKTSQGKRRGDSADNDRKAVAVVEEADEKNNEFTNQNFNEFQDTVPDLPAGVKREKAVLSTVSKDVCEYKACWTPVKNILLSNKKRASTSSEDTLNQDHVINKKKIKQNPSSISDDKSEKIGRMQSAKEIVTSDKVDKVDVEICERSNQQPVPQNHLNGESGEHTKQRDWHIESEATFKSVLLNETIEESLIYRKKYIVSKDVNGRLCNKNPSGKNVKSHRKSEKRLTSELNSCDVKPKKMREKSKERFSDGAESLISQINKQYTAKEDIKSTRKISESVIDNEISNRSDLQLSKEKIQKKSFRQLKTTFVNVTSECQLNDVYSFNLSGADDPVIKLGVQEFQTSARETCMDNSVKLVDVRNRDQCESPLKTKDKSIITNYKKEHLFSDNETDHRCEDSMTDISWLQEPKSKPQLTDYSRSKNPKRHRPGKPRSSTEREQPGCKVIPSENINRKVHEIVPDGRTRLPRKATKTKINYKDLSDSESESEHSRPFKGKLPSKEENTHSRSKNMDLPKKPGDVHPAQTQAKLPKEQKSLPPQDEGRHSSLDASLATLPGTPSSVEVMRGIQKTTERAFTQDCDCITTPASPLQKYSSLGSLNSETESGSSVQSALSKEKNVLSRRKSFSPIPYPPFLPIQSAITKNNTVVSRKDRNSSACTEESQNCSSCSSVSSWNSEKLSLENELPDTIESHLERKKEENFATSLSPMSTDRAISWNNMSWDTTHASGPTHHPNRMRMYMEDTSSNSDEVEMEEGGGTHLLPPKLFKIEDTAHHSYKMYESISTFSEYQFSIPEDDWEIQHSAIRMMIEKLNNEYKRRMKSKQRSIASFTKKSWNTAQQHMNTANQQIQEQRNKNLEKFHFILIQELENFEKESKLLKSLEKDLMEFGEKVSKKFTDFQKNEQHRLRLLKTSFDKNVAQNTGNEENIITSEMCALKEDMKKLQEQMLKEMLEEELHYVRKGLKSLFPSSDTCGTW